MTTDEERIQRGRWIKIRLWRYGGWSSGQGVGLATQWSWVRSPAVTISVGWYWDGWPSSGGHTIWACNQPPKPTHPPTCCGTESEYRPKCGDALRLGSKGRMAHSFRWLDGCIVLNEHNTVFARSGPLDVIGLSLGLPESSTQTLSRSLQKFLECSLGDRPTDRPTDHAT